MKCSEIIKILEKQSPSEYALDWDNVGLLVGRRDKEVKKLLLCVDATKEVCEYAIENKFDMIVTHHPMIFGKMRRVNDETVLGNKIISLIEAGICCYAMHTNFDTKGGMGKLAADMIKLKNKEVLEETKDGEGIGMIGIMDETMTLKELSILIKNTFELSNVIVFGEIDNRVEKIAISPGSGKSVIDTAINKGCNCLVTGDIGHHDAIDAMECGLNIIDASHYGIEKIFMKFMENYLKDYISDVEIGIIDIGVPYTII